MKKSGAHQQFYASVERILLFHIEQLEPSFKEEQNASLKTSLLKELILRNEKNAIVFQKFLFKSLPHSFGQVLLECLLKNSPLENLYYELNRETPLNVTSVFESRIQHEITFLANKQGLMKLPLINEIMNASKKVLSFYEKQQNKLVNDNLNYLTLLIVLEFQDNPGFLLQPQKLIGYLFTLTGLISRKMNAGFEFIIEEDPKLGENLFETFTQAMEAKQCPDLLQKIRQLWTQEQSTLFQSDYQKIFYEILKKFLNTFGFNILEYDCARFLMLNSLILFHDKDTN